MRAAWHILSKVILKQFYITNAGFFLFAFIFFFGIVDSARLVQYHHSLMLSMLSLPLFLFIVMLMWLLYNFKCITFCIRSLQATNGLFLYQLRAIPVIKQWLLFSGISVLLYMPVFAYSCVLGVVAYKTNAIASLIQMAGWQLLMIIMGAASIFVTINKTSESAIATFLAAVSKRLSIRVSYRAFLLAYILHSRKIAFVAVKTFSLLLLSVLFVRNSDRFDADLFSIFYPLTITAHAALVFYAVDFNETLLHCNRNLPLHWLRVAMMYLLTWSIMLLPEAAFMLINNQGNLPVPVILMQSLTAMASLLLFTGMAYACALDMERYLLFVFMAYIVILILQKSLGHLITLVAIAALGLSVFKAHYYSFEREK